MESFIVIISLVMFLSCCVCLSQALHHPRFDNSTDMEALLSFKSSVSNDPHEALHTWNSNTSFCDWNGVICNVDKYRVTGLVLGNFSLSGTITPAIANLSFLRVLELENNSFSGAIPREIDRLYRLETLILASNDITGTIPPSISHCSRLRIIDLSKNQLEGTIPSDIGLLSNLVDVSFSKNNLTGTIPPSFANCSFLNNLILMSNKLHGVIPSELGRLNLLLQLHLADNDISGEIPNSVYNISSLLILSLAKNRLSGRLPSDIFVRLPKLQTLFVGGNLLEGSIPASLSNATALERIDLSVNNFTGQIPSQFNLPNIQILNLEYNYFVSDAKHGLNFITSLANSTLLRVFSVATNQLTGQLPSSLGNLSNQLALLVMTENYFEGSIPEEIGNLGGLISLALESNSLSGSIPSTIGNLQNLQSLSLHWNHLSGSLPESLGKLKQLYELTLYSNNLTGQIPSTLSNCKYLASLDLSSNKFNGDIPREIFSLSSLGKLLNLSWNSLTGSLPPEIGNLKMVQVVDISKNHLSGKIPATIGGCSNLLYLDLSGNSFQGSIPDAIAKLKGVEYIDLSSNSLSGPIPSSLDSLQFLQLLNISANNHLQGEVPKKGVFANLTSFYVTKNSELCGGVPNLGLPKCGNIASVDRSKKRSKTKLIVILVAVSAFTLCILTGLILLMWCYLRRKHGDNRNPKEEVMLFDNARRFYTFYDLRAATDGFSPSNLIGEGSFGSVYKGLMTDGTPVAVKVFNLQQHGAFKSFLYECEALRNVRHRNLVKILSACSSSEFKALVLQFMPNGSLENWLSSADGSRFDSGRVPLTLIQRLQLAADVALAMEYLHHECETPFVHCDLKPSNILLDEDMTAHVADFGLARMLHGDSTDRHRSSTLGLKGSIGYIAPEYGYGGGVTTKGDVYSYGILLLEMFTGKKPTNKMFKEGLNLQKWVVSTLPDRLVEILDSDLVKDYEIWSGETFLGVLKLGLSCAAEVPEERPSMRDVSAIIRKTKDLLHNNVIS
ncbi:hypothetical protein Scep_005432 [Stephania cephalantha]|uniref:non-specific serine/threonine protein kinase n=1 Tax=Stephania cephalantha TaxID=152367 RepID=A0AAP0PWC7_9MAGN